MNKNIDIRKYLQFIEPTIRRNDKEQWMIVLFLKGFIIPSC